MLRRVIGRNARGTKAAVAAVLAVGTAVFGVWVWPAAGTVADGDVTLGSNAGPTCTVNVDANCENATTRVTNTGTGDALAADLISTATGASAMLGTAENKGNGVVGTSNAGPLGLNNKFAAAVFADNTSTGTALWARNLNNGGNGAFIEAYGSHSTALRVHAGNSATALKVEGVVKFDRSGKVTVPTGKTAFTVTLGQVTPSSMVLATLQRNVAGLYVLSAVPGTGSFTIHLSKAAPKSGAKVAYFVLN